MYWALAMILVAAAAFSTLVVLRRPADVGAGPASRVDVDQVRGFIYVGSAALVVLAAGVIVVGLVAADSGKAEALAVLGFFGYALYLAAAVGVLAFMSRRSG